MKSLKITPDFTFIASPGQFIASPGQQVKMNLLDALSREQQKQVERARKAGRAVDINGKIVVSFLEVGEDEDKMTELPGVGVVLDSEIKFDAKPRAMELIRDVLDVLTSACVRKKPIKVRTQLGEGSCKVTRLGIEENSTLLTFAKEVPTGS